MRIERLERIFSHYAPPEDLTVTQWAEKNRVLSRESAAESGPWRTSRTPYLLRPMELFTDPNIKRIVMVAASQVGKSELELNIIGYIIDQDPGSILYIQPTLDDARKFSRLRIAPMIRDSRTLRRKVSDVKSKDSGNTILQKSFPGGMLTITGSNSASSLASTPVRYVIGDERDRWALSAGTEGDPWSLAKARQTTFYNAKSVEVSTPTIRGSSNIEDSYYEGTQERWKHQCPHCMEYHEITFDNIRYEHISEKKKGKRAYTITDGPDFRCPGCACLTSEAEMRAQPAQWMADNPETEKIGVVSFWLNAFSSPWVPWSKIVQEFLEAQDNPLKLQTVFNTLLGQLWEDRGDMEDEEGLLARREDYGAELPDGVLVLTCAVDTQGDRLEYEVVGWGHFKESWGIQKGFIQGRPDDPEVWAQLDDVVDRVYRFKDGKGLKISITLWDQGGHYATAVKTACHARFHKKVFAISGSTKHDAPLVMPATKVPVREDSNVKCYHYTLGVDAGKAIVMSNLKVQEPGANYCHFPKGEERGYDFNYFNGLLSERFTQVKGRDGRMRWGWVKLPGHIRNEPLDLRNYNTAAIHILNPNMDAVERRLKGQSQPAGPKQLQRRTRRATNQSSEW